MYEKFRIFKDRQRAICCHRWQFCSQMMPHTQIIQHQTNKHTCTQKNTNSLVIRYSKITDGPCARLSHGMAIGDLDFRRHYWSGNVREISVQWLTNNWGRTRWWRIFLFSFCVSEASTFSSQKSFSFLALSLWREKYYVKGSLSSEFRMWHVIRFESSRNGCSFWSQHNYANYFIKTFGRRLGVLSSKNPVRSRMLKQWSPSWARQTGRERIIRNRS